MIEQADLDALIARGYTLNSPTTWRPGACYNINADGRLYGPNYRSRMKEMSSVPAEVLRAALRKKTTTVVPGYGTYHVRPLKASVRVGCSTFSKADLRRVVEASDRMVRRSTKDRTPTTIPAGNTDIVVETDGSVGLGWSVRREDRATIRAFARAYLRP